MMQENNLETPEETKIEQPLEKEIKVENNIDINSLSQSLDNSSQEITKQLKNISVKINNLSSRDEEKKDTNLYYNTVKKKVVTADNEVASTKQLFEKGIAYVNSPRYDGRFAPQFVEFMEKAIEADNNGEPIGEFINKHVHHEVDLKTLKF